MVQTIARNIKSKLRHIAIRGSVSWAHRSPKFREWLLSLVSRSLNDAYIQTSPDLELLHLQNWFGKSLLPFARRLISERPRAAKAVVRFMYQFETDVWRRSRATSLGLVAPSTVVLEPTSRCNLNCPGCYAKSTRKGHDMPYELLEATVRECAAMGTTLITLSGGEPFLREKEDASVTQLAARFPNLGFLIYTNSLCIDEQVADRIGRAGNIFVAISIEGSENASDARRGEGYYRKALQVRQMLAAREVLYGCSVTVTRQNVDHVTTAEFIDRRIAEGDMFAWYFLLQPIGRCPDVNMMVTADQRAIMRERLYEFRASGRPIFIGDFWNDGQFVDGCIAGGKHYFHIYANGDISPCVFAPVACGNMQDILSGKSQYKSLTDFVNNHPLFRAFREKQKEIKDYRAPCMLIDHPEKFREICARYPWYSAVNMPDGYLDGAIADHVAETAKLWTEKLAQIPVIPDCVRNSRQWKEIESHSKTSGGERM